MDRLYLLGRLVEAGVFLSLAFGAGWQGARWKYYADESDSSASRGGIGDSASYENQRQPIVSLGGKGDS